MYKLKKSFQTFLAEKSIRNFSFLFFVRAWASADEMNLSRIFPFFLFYFEKISNLLRVRRGIPAEKKKKTKKYLICKILNINRRQILSPNLLKTAKK